MAFSANCPACGAPVVFRSSVSFHVVCEFCRSTLVRHGGNLENLGKMADLLEDASPIQLATEGSYRGVHFAVVGRIQLRYTAGIWNEWYLLLKNDKKKGQIWLKKVEIDEKAGKNNYFASFSENHAKVSEKVIND